MEEGKLSWMYDGDKSVLNREEYLLGKKIDSNFEKKDAEEKGKGPVYKVEHEILPGSVARRDIGQMQVDLARKVSEDPLFQIRKQETQTMQELMDNPVKRKQLEKIQKAELEGKTKKKSKKKKDIDKKLFAKMVLLLQNDTPSSDEADNAKPKAKKNKKDKKSRHKRKKRVRQSSSDSGASSGTGSPAPQMKRKEKSRKKRSVAPEQGSSDEEESRRKRRRFSSDSRQHNSDHHRAKDRHSDDIPSSRQTDRHRHVEAKGAHSDRNHPNRSAEDRRGGHSTIRSGRERGRSSRGERRETAENHQRSSAIHAKRADSPEHTRGARRREDDEVEEMERKRREMMDDAKWRDRQRADNVARYDQESEREEQEQERRPERAQFVQEQLRTAADRTTVEARIKSKRHNIQRSAGHMDRSFVKR